MVVQDGPVTLARCLVELGRQLQATPRMNWLSMSEPAFRSQLARRVERLMKLPPGEWSRRGRSWAAWQIAFVSLMLTLGVLAGAQRALPSAGWPEVSLPMVVRLAFVEPGSEPSAGLPQTRTPELPAQPNPTSDVASGVAPVAAEPATGAETAATPRASEPARAPVAASANELPSIPQFGQVPTLVVAPRTEASGDSAVPRGENLAAAGGLATRLYKLDAAMIRESLEKIHSSTNGLQPGAFAETLRSFLAEAGVDWGGTNLSAFSGGFESPSHKSFLLNEQTGSLLVRAKPEELDLIEATVQTLNIPAPQVVLTVRFAEVSAITGLGMDWYFDGAALPGPTNRVDLTNTLTGIMSDPQFKGMGRAGGAGSSPPHLPALVNGASGTSGAHIDLTSKLTSGASTGTVAGSALRVQLPENGWPNAADARVERLVGPTIASILDERTFDRLLKSLDSRPGTDILAAPKVITPAVARPRSK